MNRLSTTLLAAGVAVMAAVPAADAASNRTSPVITLVSPMRVQVGKNLTVRGRHFKASKRANKVILEGANGRKVIIKPSTASTTKLTFKVPSAAERILTAKNGAGQPTRVHLRVLTNSLGARSGLRQSPVITSARSGGGTSGSKPGSTTTGGRTTSSRPASSGGGTIPAACGSGSDWDGDLLDNATELSYGLNPCSADSDGDSMSDGWEFWSAKDLNVAAVPYPGRKPYPNPLDGSDGNIDFDGDSLTGLEEFRAWQITGRSYDPAAVGSRLGYSAGTQYSRPNAVPAVPAFTSQNYGLYPTWTRPAYPGFEDRNGDGRWRDDERDADADGLINFVETHGSGHASWWTAVLAGEKPTPPEAWPGTDPTDPANYSKNYFGAFTERPFADTELDVADVDGDGLLDGEDDQDNDDVPNYTEMYATGSTVSIGGQNRRKNAFNPCAPDVESRTCPVYFPIK